jgi:ferredoxin
LLPVKDRGRRPGYASPMSARKIISIDHDRCNGCGQCIPNCPEGALQVIDGKARLISDLFCDGLGACIGHCPEGAIEIVEREAEPYDERRVMAVIAPQGANTIRAHLQHLQGHGETELLSQATAYLEENNIPVPPEVDPLPQALPREAAASRLGNWPIQLHLLSPLAPALAGKDVLLSADCVAHAVPDFQEKFLKGKALAIACPKLDEGKDVYRDKIIAMIDKARINTLTVVMMEVPCCRGLLAIVQDAASRAQRKVPLKAVIVAIENGETLAEEWV